MAGGLALGEGLGALKDAAHHALEQARRLHHVHLDRLDFAPVDDHANVSVAFDAGNLLPVAQAMREQYPGRRFIFWADDDYQRMDRNGHPENIGIIKATEAAQAVNGHLAVPDFGPNRPEGATDFNDLFQMMKGSAC